MARQFWEDPKSAEIGVIAEIYEQEIERLQAERDRLKALCECTYCAYCGFETHLSDIEAANEAVSAHIAECDKHPMRAVEAERDRLRDILLDVVQAHPTGLIRRLYRRINKALAEMEKTQ